MGFVTQFFIKPTKPPLVQLPSGSFTVNPEGQIMTSTLPHPFMTDHAQAMGERVLAAFKSAERLELPFTEFAIDFGAIRVVARKLRGGAMIFVAPRAHSGVAAMQAS